MADFDLSARISGDASGLVAAATQGETAIEGVGNASRRAAGGSKELETATASASATTERASAAANTLSATLAASATARQRVATATSQLDIAESRAAAAVAKLELAHRAAAKASDDDADAQLRIIAALASAEARVAATALAVTNAQVKQAAGLRDLSQAATQNTAAANRQQYAIRNVGQQFGDFGLQVASGQDAARAFGQQAGQLGYALSEMGGKLGAVGRFLTGPWGIALTIAAAFAAPLLEKLLSTTAAAADQAKALDTAVTAADSYGAAQSNLGKVIDLTTGKLKSHNVVLIETIKLQAQANFIAAQQDQREATKKLAGAGSASLLERFSDNSSAIGGSQYGVGVGNSNRVGQALRERAASLGPLSDTLKTYTDAAKAYGEALADPRSSPAAIKAASDQYDKSLTGTISRIGGAAKTAGRDVIETKRLVLDLGSALKAQQAARESTDALNGKGVSSNLIPYKPDAKPKKTPKPKSTDAVEEFGLGAADKIANIVGRFDDAPAVIDKTNEKVRELDRLIEQLGRRKPPGFGDLIAQAEAAKIVVRDGLINEVARAFEQPKTMAEKATAAIGQLDAVIADLSKNKPPSFDKLIADANRAKGVIADSIQKPFRDYIKDQQESLEIQRLTATGHAAEADQRRQILALEKQGPPLTIEQKDAVLATVQALRAQQRELDVLREKNAKYLEALGGIKGVVEDATQAFVRGDLGQLIKSPGKILDVFQTLQGRAVFDKLFQGIFRDLEDQVNGTATVKDASDRMATAVDKASSSIVQLGNAADAAARGVSGAGAGGATDLNSLLARGNGVTGPGPNGGQTSTTGADIIVNGSRAPRDPTALVSTALGKVSTSIAGLFTNPANASKIGASIGKFAGKGLEGAATGSIVAGVGKAIGVNLNKTGAQLGGAAGNILSSALGFAGPLGSILGSLGGGLIGNLFAPKAKPGGATVSSVNGSADVSGSVGSDSKGIAAGKGLGSSVASGINSIAQQLGGVIGDFNVQIGKYKDDLRVNQNGKALGGVKGSGATSFGDDEAAATSYAISLAIAQGAVKGLSPAIQKALASNTDVDKALAEALKVKQVETLIGGLGSALKEQFNAFDATANDRVRVARQYGLDVAAVEKINAEQRVKLVDDALKSRVASLSDFLQSVKFGDLFEGSASDRRAALIAEIAKVQKDAEAGIDGAADKLASLNQQLVTTSKEAFGTAGAEFSTDRANSISGVEKVIQMETDRVNAASAATATTTAAIQAGNALANEGNDIAAQQLAALKTIAANSSGSGGGGASANIGAVRRSAFAIE